MAQRGPSEIAPCRGLPTLGALLLSASLIACTVVESYRIPDLAEDPLLGTPCASRLGSYSLPRAHLQIQVAVDPTSKKIGIVEQSNAGAFDVPGAHSPVKIKRHPDPVLAFCTDHVNSLTSDDKVSLLKWPLLAHDNNTVNEGPAQENVALQKSSILGAVTVNATDRSVYIIRALIRALFIAISGNADFPARRALIPPGAILADLEFDPFNPAESATVNARLSKLGFCLVLEDITFDVRRISIDQYCDDPERYAEPTTLVTKAYVKIVAEPVNPLMAGVHYRPRYPYRLMTYEKPDRKDRWHLSRLDTVELENASPVMTLAIGRAAFASRSAYFLFDEGTLLTACLSKTSELEAFATIPLEVSRAIVELPASIFKIQINQYNGLNDLAKVQQQLYLAQQAQIQAATGKPYKKPDNTGTAFDNSKYPQPVSYNTLPTGLETPAPGQGVAAYGTDKILGRDLTKLCKDDGK